MKKIRGGGPWLERKFRLKQHCLRDQKWGFRLFQASNLQASLDYLESVLLLRSLEYLTIVRFDVFHLLDHFLTPVHYNSNYYTRRNNYELRK